MHRLIARLDIKGENLIKSVQLDGVRVVGDPRVQAQLYYEQGIDELVFMDAVASLYNRNQLSEVVSYTCENVFIPLTVGGGLRSLADVEEVLQAGADKVAINTAAVAKPELITEVARTYGSQCMVLQIDAKKISEGKWEAWVDAGREPTGLDAVEWAKRVVDIGAGEILLTSVDREGTRLGFEWELVKAVSEVVPVPVIASGGMGSLDHLVEVFSKGKADAAAMADALHVQKTPVQKIKTHVAQAGIAVRI
jgi:cyclase